MEEEDLARYNLRTWQHLRVFMGGGGVWLLTHTVDARDDLSLVQCISIRLALDIGARMVS